MVSDGILCINKPENITSNDVVMRVKRCFNTSKIGHTGTLDPNATGVLVLLVNKATKALPYLDIQNKTYLASCKIGIKTSTGDIWGEVLESSDKRLNHSTDLAMVLESFRGKYLQTPPMVSAKKKNGKKLYELARKGIEIEREPTVQEIFAIELLSSDESEFTFRAQVSSGTYIRTLCEDICSSIGLIGTMSSLCREQVGQFTLDDCIDLDKLNDQVELSSTIERIMLPKIECGRFIEEVFHGKRVSLESEFDTVLLVDGLTAIAVYQRENDQQFKSVRGLW